MQNAKTWLTNCALPLWLKNGLDLENGGFLESLTLEGTPMKVARRAMVQSRQIYTFRTALELNLCPPEPARKAIASGSDFLIAKYSHSSGGFIHSVDVDGKPQNTAMDLYTQAFALFGMANAYAIKADEKLVQRSKTLIEYLQSERQVPGGGFSEFDQEKIVYRSNPHMHLFEAAIFWAEVHRDPIWLQLADGVLELCLTRFMDPVTGFIGEYFNQNWQIISENGRFVFEPGHQFEWSWLMGRYEKVTGKSLIETRLRLYDGAENYGVTKAGLVIDEVWSDHSAKLQSSRFWPQCERIKAAVELAGLNPRYAAGAEQGMKALFKFFDLPIQGLWYDTLESSGTFRIQPAKASSFYHIMGAISEYLRLNPK